MWWCDYVWIVSYILKSSICLVHNWRWWQLFRFCVSRKCRISWEPLTSFCTMYRTLLLTWIKSTWITVCHVSEFIFTNHVRHACWYCSSNDIYPRSWSNSTFTQWAIVTQKCHQNQVEHRSSSTLDGCVQFFTTIRRLGNKFGNVSSLRAWAPNEARPGCSGLVLWAAGSLIHISKSVGQ